MSEIPFRRVARLEDVPEHCGLTVELDGSELALFRDGAQVWCTEGRCPHTFELMSKAVFANGTVECLAHHYCFDLETGKAVRPSPGAAFLKRYPVKVENGEVHVAFEGGDDEW